MRHNILLATIVALMTAVGTVALLYPTTAIAEDEPAGLSAKIAQPVLEVNGCTLTLALATTDLKPGDPVHLLLTATNPTDEPVEFEVQATAAAMSAPEDMMVRSRRMPQPSQIWQETCPISLSAGQTMEIVLETTYLAEAGALVTLSLQAGEQVVAFNTVAVQAPAEDAPVDPPADEPEGTTDESTVHL